MDHRRTACAAALQRDDETGEACAVFEGIVNLGLSVDTQRNEIFQTPGRFGWDGGFGTSAYTDPAKEMIGMLFTQRMVDSPEPAKVFTDFWTLAYALGVNGNHSFESLRER